jgi:hypothetical protein
VGRGEWLREQLEQTHPRGHDRGAGREERLVPEPELVAIGLALADRPQQAVALLQGAAVGGHVGA